MWLVVALLAVGTTSAAIKVALHIHARLLMTGWSQVALSGDRPSCHPYWYISYSA